MLKDALCKLAAVLDALCNLLDVMEHLHDVQLQLRVSLAKFLHYPNLHRNNKLDSDQAGLHTVNNYMLGSVNNNTLGSVNNYMLGSVNNYVRQCK